MFRITSSLIIVMSLGCGSATAPDEAAQLAELFGDDLSTGTQRMLASQSGEFVWLDDARETEIFGNDVTDDDLVQLKRIPGLKELTLGQSLGVTDAGLVHLTGLTGLESISLRETQVTDAGISELQKALPNS
jgi:hypothetical protein